MDKTNALRFLDSKKIEYKAFTYDSSITDGISVAKQLNEDPDQVFKTLVTVGNNKEHYVFVIPVNTNLDLKKAAKVAGCKSIEMIHQKELLPLTGYIHGGCSPIGMKKLFKTFINETAILYDTICVSAGKVGIQIQIDPNILIDICNATFVDLTV